MSHWPRYDAIGTEPVLWTYVAPDGVVVYGTGWDYPPYLGSLWIGPPVTYGFGAGFEWGAATGFTLGFTTDPFWSPWWGPVGWGWGWGYRHVPVGFYHHWPLYHGNIYNRWGDRVVATHVRNTFVGRVGNTRVVQHSRIGDLYAGHEGNVYRFQHGQWQRYEGNDWRPFAFHNPEPNHAQTVESFRQRAGAEGEGLRGHEQIGGRAGGMLGGHESVESLNREATARSLGESRWNDFRSGGGLAANHLAGRGFGGGFGAFHGGGFGSGHGGGHR